MTKLLCGGEMNGIQRATLRRTPDRCGAQNAIVDAHEIQPLKQSIADVLPMANTSGEI